MANQTINQKDKFICYCSRVTFKAFIETIQNNSSDDLNKICKDKNIAVKCAACLHNIEDVYMHLRGTSKNELSRTIKIKDQVPITRQILNFLDSLSGTISVKQYGFLPMLASKNIETWMIVSNDKPNSIEVEPVEYKLAYDIYNSEGKKIKSIKKTLKPHKIYKVCLNKYLTNLNETLLNYFVRITRQATSRGLRGSTRPHFIYKTNDSMSSLHTQDGGRLKFKTEIFHKNKTELRWLFLINPNKRPAKFTNEILLRDNNNLRERKMMKINSNGCCLLPLTTFNINNARTLISLKSDKYIKPYLIISDKNFSNISADHL